MSFLFKAKQKGNSANTTPNATAPSSRDGPGSQIPVSNGGNKASSPTSVVSANNSLNSLAGGERTNSIPRAMGHSSQVSQDKMNYPRDDTSRIGGPASPDHKQSRDRAQDMGQYAVAPRGPPLQSRAPPPDSSPYPWSQRRLDFSASNLNPFPRYGAAVNATASKDGAIYLMGGLINGSTVKGDLWMVDAAATGNGACFPVATTSEGPGPRVGHASLLVGNAFMVFGGDTKMDEGDQLDDTLYLLNTSTKQWSRALPAGTRPPGRYGHTLNILGSKIYIFGGQVEGYFFNDLVAFDLNMLQSPQNRWEILIQNSIDGGPPQGQIPPARTNHTMISWGDKLFLFGGTDGVNWFNDVWSYTPQTNSWAQLDCIGYIPSPREGHAAALVGDVMYIFGGRTEEGNDLGDLASFRISSRRWYTFQNMGPSPSPRSGHSMTTVGKSIVILAGEPSSVPRDPIELGLAYYLDTSKIRYPPDSTASAQANDRSAANSRQQGDRSLSSPTGRGQNSMDSSRMVQVGEPRAKNEPNSRLPRASSAQGGPILPAPTGPPPQAPPQAPQQASQQIQQIPQQTQPIPQQTQPTPQTQPQPKTNGIVPPQQSVAGPERTRNLSTDINAPRSLNGVGVQGSQSGEQTPRAESRPVVSPVPVAESRSYADAPIQSNDPKRTKPDTYQPSQEQPVTSVKRNPLQQQSKTPVGPRKQSVDTTAIMNNVSGPITDDMEGPQDSGIGSSPSFNRQHDDVSRELEGLKQKNAWYASELALARKSGYQTRAADSPVFDERTTTRFADDEKPLIEALLQMRTELARMQSKIENQSKNAADRIAHIEKQRDAAVSEAVFAKAKLAGHGSPQPGEEAKRGTPDLPERNNEMSRRLASSLTAQSEFSRRVDSLIQEVEAERSARKLAEDASQASQKRLTELEQHRQQYNSEIEGLRSELHDTQQAARELASTHAEISSQHQMLTIDKKELSEKLSAASNDTQNHTSLLTSLREAVTASTEKSSLLERKLDEERAERDLLDQKLRVLESEHRDRTSELEKSTRRLRDAEEVATRHAEEARSHREAVLAGLNKVAVDRSPISSSSTDERVSALQQQAEAARALVRQNQAAADAASEKLRRAEERIAGLEVYQEQASRESLSIRKQLQEAIKENQVLQSERAGLQQKYQNQMLEANALAVQHSSLKDILGERGINAAEVRRSRALDSPSATKRLSTPDLNRVRDLEQQLETSMKNHDDVKRRFEEATERDEKAKREYEEKLTALDNDHQAAVKYLRGTEKMLSKMKQELQRVKNENGDLKKRADKLQEIQDTSTPADPSSWDTERASLRKELEDTQANLSSKVGVLETRIKEMQDQLHSTELQLQQSRSSHDALQVTHGQHTSDLERLRRENVNLQERARDAENKVQLLLDQVEHSVDNYRRQSKLATDGQATTLNGVFHTRNFSGGSHMSNHNGHARKNSDGNESTHSSAGVEEARNSMALDSLATELDALRSHWETTNKSYRLSDRFDFERTPTAEHSQSHALAGNLASWRQNLDVSDESRPGTSEGTIKGHSSHTSAETAGPAFSTGA